MTGATERVVLASPLALAGGRVIASPFQFYVTGEDNLQVVSTNSLSGVRVAVQGRYLTPAGEIKTFGFTHTPNADRTTKSDIFQLGIGAVLNLTMFASAGSPRIGQTFVQAKLIRGLAGATIVLGTLLQGYITAAQELSWPGSPLQDSLEAGGVLRILTGTNPAAGSEILETVPTGAQWELLSFRATFVTSTAAATRLPALEIDDGTTTYIRIYSAQGNTANLTAYWYWTKDALASYEATTFYNIVNPLGSLTLLPGHRIKTVTGAIQSGDNWGAPTYTVIESLEGS